MRAVGTTWMSDDDDNSSSWGTQGRHGQTAKMPAYVNSSRSTTWHFTWHFALLAPLQSQEAEGIGLGHTCGCSGIVKGAGSTLLWLPCLERMLTHMPHGRYPSEAFQDHVHCPKAPKACCRPPGGWSGHLDLKGLLTPGGGVNVFVPSMPDP